LSESWVENSWIEASMGVWLMDGNGDLQAIGDWCLFAC